MRFAALVLVLAAAACGPADTSPEPTVSPSSDGCFDRVVVGVRGQNQSPDANGGLGTEVRRVSDELRRRWTGQTVQVRSIDYRSDPPADLTSYREAADRGAVRLDRDLDAIERDCPRSRITVIGFSMGADLVHTALADRPVGSIVRVGLIADPRRDPAAPAFTFGGSAPHPGSLGRGPRLRTLKDRATWFCAPGDSVCNHPPGGSVTNTGEVHKKFYERRTSVVAIAERLD